MIPVCDVALPPANHVLVAICSRSLIARPCMFLRYAVSRFGSRARPQLGRTSIHVVSHRPPPPPSLDNSRGVTGDQLNATTRRRIRYLLITSHCNVVSFQSDATSTQPTATTVTAAKHQEKYAALSETTIRHMKSTINASRTSCWCNPMPCLSNAGLKLPYRKFQAFDHRSEVPEGTPLDTTYR